MKVLSVPYKAIFCGDIPLHRAEMAIEFVDDLFTYEKI